MDYNIKKENLYTSETVFDEVIEQPVDMDFSLPDYCPDIQKILRCQISPQINSKNISGDKLFIEGLCIISILYLEEEKNSIRCCKHSSPFSLSINLKSSFHNAIIFTKTKIEYVNCRAVTPRRLDIHGAFSIFTKLKIKKENEIVCDIEGTGIEKKKISAKCNNILELNQQYFNLSETIDKGSTLPEIEEILKTNLNIDLQDYKILQNKIMINALAIIKVVYISDIEYSNIETLEHTVPISQIVDIEGVQDNCKCDINIDVLNYDISIKPNNNNENNLLSFDCKISVCTSVYEEKDINILSDVYSIDYEYEPKYEKISLINFQNILNKPYIIKSNIDIDNTEISELLDVSAEIPNVNSFIKDQKINFEGKINVCMLAKDTEEIPVYFERLVEFSFENEFNSISDSIFCEENIKLKSCECRIVGKNLIEVTAEIQIGANIYFENKYESITDIFIDEEKPISKNKKTALTIYYPNNGEDLWDIAKKYCTSVEKIKNENEIDQDKLQDKKMLFIPM